MHIIARDILHGVNSKFKQIILNDDPATEARWDEIVAFAVDHGALAQLVLSLHALISGSNVIRVQLFFDHAPLSMGFNKQYGLRADGSPAGSPSEVDHWDSIIGGGMIYEGPGQPQDGSGPAFTVSLSQREPGVIHRWTNNT